MERNMRLKKSFDKRLVNGTHQQQQIQNGKKGYVIMLKDQCCFMIWALIWICVIVAVVTQDTMCTKELEFWLNQLLIAYIVQLALSIFCVLLSLIDFEKAFKVRGFGVVCMLAINTYLYIVGLADYYSFEGEVICYDKLKRNEAAEGLIVAQIVFAWLTLGAFAVICVVGGVTFFKSRKPARF